MIEFTEEKMLGIREFMRIIGRWGISMKIGNRPLINIKQMESFLQPKSSLYETVHRSIVPLLCLNSPKDIDDLSRGVAVQHQVCLLWSDRDVYVFYQ